MALITRLRTHPRRQVAVAASLLFATAVCLLQLGVRAVYARSTVHFHLVWNLFLAWLPMLSADRLQPGNARPLAQLAARLTLPDLLAALLRALHPHRHAAPATAGQHSALV
ncbi:hypothetical protein [Candidatus Amarolinea dominans]|uniref:hypothetical protein n=1 Tax=Candidatus Amarolinea dominans TaxID=3140696 RepID=UPI0031CC5E2B